jgi:HAD superfamily hydrolase (TIGR01509 family)
LIPAFPVYLFDIDGTLLDSAPDICAAIGQVIVEEGAQAPSFSYLRRFVGLHLTDCFADVFPTATDEKIAALIEQYRGIYRARGHAETRIFPGVAEGLALLGGRKATATTKGTPMARMVVEQFGLAPHFDHVQGTDGFPSKPEPDVIHAALKAIGAGPADCLMVGDSHADILAARAAGVKVCAVRYGYGDPEVLARLEPDFWIGDIRELAG